VKSELFFLYAKNQRDLVKIPDPKVPVFVGDPKTFLKKIKPTDKPLVFQTKHLGEPNDVTLIPFYKTNHERYSDWKNNPAQISAMGDQLLQTALNEN
jgi:hypothetical protein